MAGRFLLQNQGAVFRILGIFLLAFLYEAITLSGRVFQLTSSRQVRKDPSPTTPHPGAFLQQFGLLFALFTRRY